jgi:hypothetical protein
MTLHPGHLELSTQPSQEAHQLSLRVPRGVGPMRVIGSPFIRWNRVLLSVHAMEEPRALSDPSEQRMLLTPFFERLTSLSNHSPKSSQIHRVSGLMQAFRCVLSRRAFFLSSCLTRSSCEMRSSSFRQSGRSGSMPQTKPTHPNLSQRNISNPEFSHRKHA